MGTHHFDSGRDSLSKAFTFARKLGFHGTVDEWDEFFDRSRRPKVIGADTDLSSLRPRRYRVENESVAGALSMPTRVPGVLGKLPSDSSHRVYCFQTLPEDDLPAALWMTASLSNELPQGPWWLVEASFSNENRTASEQILDLARIDGWTAVYDPTNATTTVVNSRGEIQTLADGLDQMPSLSLGSADDTVPLFENEFGILSGFQAGEGTLSTTFTQAQRLPQPNTVIVLAHSATSVPGQRFLFDGIRKSRQTVHTLNEPGIPLTIWSGTGPSGGDAMDTEPHVFTATFHGTDTRLSVDSRTYLADSNAKSNRTLGGLTLGGDHQGARRWAGSIGPVLIRQGETPEDVRYRMESLLLRLSGLRPQPPRFPDDLTVYSVDSRGNPTFAHGAVNTVAPDPGIASITKLMTAWLARQAFSADPDLAERAEVLSKDRHKHSYQRFLAGDIVSHEDLLRAMLMVSDNTAPFVLARVLGDRLENGNGDPVGLFVSEMNAEAARLGYQGAEFTTPWNFARMSAAQIADLHQRMIQDDFLLNAMGTLVHEVTIDGPRQRLQPIQHRMVDSPWAPVSKMIAAKTGTWPRLGPRHVTFAWMHPDGSTHVTVVLNAKSLQARDEALYSTMAWIRGQAS